MDWKKIITDLEKRGLTQKEIGRLAECSQSYVSELKAGVRGKRLNYKIASNLIAVWEEQTPKRRATDRLEV